MTRVRVINIYTTESRNVCFLYYLNARKNVTHNNYSESRIETKSLTMSSLHSSLTSCSPYIAGATGPQGSMGYTGQLGATGSTGASGPNGNTGSTGNTGATGNKGVPGQQGVKGVRGPQGSSVLGMYCVHLQCI